MSDEAKTATCGRLFGAFLKIGAISFGGGMTMLPMMESVIADKYGWLRKEEVYEYFALSQALPGLVAPNMAALVGRRLHGPAGAACAVGGVVLPSFLVITLIALFFRRFAENELVQSIFTGLQIALVALFASVLWRMGQRALTDVVAVALFLLVFVLYLLLELSPVWFILFGAGLGLVVGGRRRRRT